MTPAIPFTRARAMSLVARMLKLIADHPHCGWRPHAYAFDETFMTQDLAGCKAALAALEDAVKRHGNADHSAP
jgi:hypothetical protein